MGYDMNRLFQFGLVKITAFACLVFSFFCNDIALAYTMRAVAIVFLLMTRQLLAQESKTEAHEH